MARKIVAVAVDGKVVFNGFLEEIKVVRHNTYIPDGAGGLNAIPDRCHHIKIEAEAILPPAIQEAPTQAAVTAQAPVMEEAAVPKEMPVEEKAVEAQPDPTPEKPKRSKGRVPSHGQH